MGFRRSSYLLVVLLAVSTLPGMLLPASAHTGVHESISATDSSSVNVDGASAQERRQLYGAGLSAASCSPKTIEAGDHPFPPQQVTDAMRQCFVTAIRYEIDAIDAERSQQGMMHSVTADFLREAFHDCGPGHCDGSLLLNIQELRRPENKNIDGPENIARIRNRVMSDCPPYQISWADAIILSTAVGIQKLGGPDMRWDIPLGRGDSTKFDGVQKLPAPTMDARALVSNFQAIFPGESPEVVANLLVTLSGAHTIGDAACATFKKRALDGLPVIDPHFQQELRSDCTRSCIKKEFDVFTENVFDNKFYKTLLIKKGLLFSDQTLLSSGDCSTGACTADIVKTYAQSQALFFSNFKWAFCKLSILGTSLSCPYSWAPLH